MKDRAPQNKRTSPFTPFVNHCTQRRNDATPQMQEQDEQGSLWKRWRNNKLIPRLAPRTRRRRCLNDLNFASTGNAEDATVEEASGIAQQPLQSLKHQAPDSPPRDHVECSAHQEETELTTTPTVQGNDFSEQQTPPAFSPLPVMVSAKRLGKEVRRDHFKRRRQRWNKENPQIDDWHSFTSSWQESSPEDEGFASLQDLTPEERTKQYWKLCYGDQQAHHESVSASKAPPVKSCLSSTKKSKNGSTLNITIETPTISARPQSTVSPLALVTYSTPSPTSHAMTPPSRKVQFGDSMAAEFLSDDPTVSLTPMPVEVSRVRFPINEVLFTDDQIADTEETKSNTSILNEWEQDFDDYIDDDLEAMLFSDKRRSNRRRDSTVFTPPPGSKGLLTEEIMSLHMNSPTRQLDAGFQQCSEIEI